MPAGGPVRLTFAGAALDRAPSERRRPQWLSARREQPDARALVLSERGAFVEEGRLLLLPPPADSVFLGLAGERPLFAADVTGAEPERGHPAGLREVAGELPAEDAALAAYAASLLSWHRRHRFCANCGQPTESRDGGHERSCPGCGAHRFPRTDPVVIVRVTDGERLLLGRQARWPEGRYSVLAGFVEPGETLEDAVRREVLEESRVEVRDVAYVASQPWPFPSSLMVGFQAIADATEPHADDDELVDVRWFSAVEVTEAAGGNGSVLLPRCTRSPPPDRRLAGGGSGRAVGRVRGRTSSMVVRAVRGAPAASSIAPAPPARRSSTLHRAGDLEPLLADPLQRTHGRAAGGDHVLDHQAALSGVELGSLDPALETVLLLVLANEERLHGRPRGEGGAGHRVGAHRHATTAVAPAFSASAATSSPSARKPSGRRIARLAST